MNSALPASPDEIVLVAPPELDLVSCTAYEEQVDEALRAAPARLVLDLAAVQFCDSSGLRVLVRAARRLTSTETVLELRRPTAAVRDLAAMTGASALLGLPRG